MAGPLLQYIHSLYDGQRAAWVRGDVGVVDSSGVFARLAKGAAGTFLRSDGTDLGYSADVTYDGTDFGIAAGKRFRMQGQNRTRHLNSIASAQPSGTQGSIAVTTWTTINLGAEDIDTDTIHTTGGSNSRLTFPLVGKWQVNATIFFDYAGATAPIQVGTRIIKNGGTTTIYGDTSADTTGSNTDATVTTSSIVEAAATTDYVEMQGIVIATSGTWQTTTTLGLTRLSAYYIGE